MLVLVARRLTAKIRSEKTLGLGLWLLREDVDFDLAIEMVARNFRKKDACTLMSALRRVNRFSRIRRHAIHHSVICALEESNRENFQREVWEFLAKSVECSSCRERCVRMLDRWGCLTRPHLEACCFDASLSLRQFALDCLRRTDINVVDGDAYSEVFIDISFPKGWDVQDTKTALEMLGDCVWAGGHDLASCQIKIANADVLPPLAQFIRAIPEEDRSVKINVVLHSGVDADGLRISPALCEFHRSVGGRLSFRFKIDLPSRTRRYESASARCEPSVDAGELKILAHVVKLTWGERDRPASTVVFRMVGVLGNVIERAREIFNDFPCEWFGPMKSGDYVVCVRVADPSTARNLLPKIHSFHGACESGGYISLRSQKQSDKVELEPYISDFIRLVGGTLDFSFVST